MTDQAASVLLQDGPKEEPTVEESVVAEPEKGGEQKTETEPKEGETAEHKKRLGGWQRKIQKLEQENELLRDMALRGKPAEEKQEVSDRPVRPKLAEFSGTVEDYEKALEEYEAALEQWTVDKREQEAVARQVEASSSALLAEVSEMEEFDDMKASVKTYKMPMRLTDLLVAEAAKLKNGAETLKALLLDPDEAAQLAEYDRYEDATSIKAQVISMSRALRAAGKKSEPEGKEESSAPQRPPKPINPVKKVAPTSTGLDDDEPIEKWMAKRNSTAPAELFGKRK